MGSLEPNAVNSSGKTVARRSICGSCVQNLLNMKTRLQIHLSKIPSLYTLLTLLLFSLSLNAQQTDPVLQQYIKAVNKDSIMSHLRVLASDAYEGRGTFEAGGEKAMQYLSQEFAKRNLQPFLPDSSRLSNKANYRQSFALQHTLFTECQIKTANEQYQYMTDFLACNVFQQNAEPHDLVFVGFNNIDSVQNDFKTANIEGKWVALILENNVLNTANLTLLLIQKAKKAKQQGAKGVFFIQTNAGNYVMTKKTMELRESKFDIAEPKTVNEFPILILNKKTTAALFGVKENVLSAYLDSIQTGKPTKSRLFAANIAMNAKPNNEAFTTSNIIGYMEGSDLNAEAIVVSSHFDHLGKKGGVIHNGANDNASGTSTMLEMLRVLDEMRKKGIKPRRTIIFAGFTAEEKGLWGSRFYTNNPLFPLDKTKFDVNIDMVGVLGSKNKRKPAKIAIIEDGNLEFRQQERKLVENYKLNLKLDYSFSDKNHREQLFFRSDHYNFAKNGIPIAFFNSMYDKNYHKPTDDITNIEPEAMQEVAKLVFATIWTEANK